MKDGAPFLHAHGTFARRDYSVIGGHVVSAVVSPLLEFVLTPTENTAVREFDESLGLYVISG
jgi:predicted DNA-binding protein with PD1-like motif